MAQTVLGKPRGVDQTHTETHFQLRTSGGLIDANYILVGLRRADFRVLQRRRALKRTHTQGKKRNKKRKRWDKRKGIWIGSLPVLSVVKMQPALHNRTQALSEGRPFDRSVLVTLPRAINVNKDHTACICCLTVNLDRIEQASREAFQKDKHVDGEHVNAAFFFPISP